MSPDNISQNTHFPAADGAATGAVASVPPHEPTEARPTVTTPRLDGEEGEEEGKTDDQYQDQDKNQNKNQNHTRNNSQNDTPNTPSSIISSVTSYFSYPVGQVVNKFYRRLTDTGLEPKDGGGGEGEEANKQQQTSAKKNNSRSRPSTSSEETASQKQKTGRRSWANFSLRRTASVSDSATTATGTRAGAMPSRPFKFSSRSHSGAGTSSNTNTTGNSSPSNSASGTYTPPPPRPRAASPFNPPPLTPLTLNATGNISPPDLLLSKSIAEEIRLLVPPRLQLIDSWTLAYSLERDGSSLATLYARCRDVAARHPRAGFVLVIKDSSAASANDAQSTGQGPPDSVAGGSGSGAGSLFGAYLSDPPRPSPHFYGTGECFLWKASIIPFAGLATASPMLRAITHPGGGNNSAGGGGGGAGGSGGGSTSGGNKGEPSQTRIDALKEANLPPPPSTDTTDLGRSTSILDSPNQSGATTPARLRFKAFPYSGINDYMIFCETGFLSIGGGDGHYGLWIDDGCEKGISSPSLTFGNEPLSDEGTKFDILGVEMWYIG